MEANKTVEPMAIVGMGCRWPGGCRDTRDLWKFLIDKQSAYRDWAPPRFSAAGYYHPNSERPGTTSAKGGYVVQEDPRLFDPSFFGISALEAETIDPSQRKLLEVVYEAFESAGESWESMNGTRTGVFVADISYDNLSAQQRDWEYARPHASTGTSRSLLSNRINYVFNLRGPSVTIDSACTSAMYGLHMAIQSIRNGDCESAIVASSNWIMDPTMQIAMDKLGALSSTSMSHFADAAADGYGRGEGFAAIYLKKPAKAFEDGSPIRALVRGSAIGANGRSNGITVPSGPAQEEVIRKAYENAGNLQPCDTPFLECHGTGTRVGDPIEIEAAGNVFGVGWLDESKDRLLVGSVKTNLGHTEGSAALASIFKAVLTLEQGFIPPSIGIAELNPKIDFVKAKAEVVIEGIPWPEGKLRRVSVTSAGFGGSIGHCILDHVNVLYPDYVKPGIFKHGSHPSTNGASAPRKNGTANRTNGTYHHVENAQETQDHLPMLSKPKASRKADATTRRFVLLPFAAHNETSLTANIDALSNVISEHSAADVAYTLAARRSKLCRRTYRIWEKSGQSPTLLLDNAKVFASPLEVPRLGLVFTGQGAQWHAMGGQLFDYQIFRSSIAHLDHVLSSLPDGPAWKIVDVISGNCEPSFIQMPEVSQTVCTAVQIGLVDLLATWSVLPSGVVGHSSGEMAAAYAAGFMTAAESIVSAFFRGKAVSMNKQKGAMLAVGLGLEQIEPYLDGHENEIKIAAINSNDSLTLSGEQEAVERLSATLTQQKIFNRLLQTGGNAYHSHHMAALGQEYEAMLTKGLACLEAYGYRNHSRRYSRVHWVSSVTPTKTMKFESGPAAYWRANLESPVRFSEAVTNLVSQDNARIGALVEIGPHPALKGPLNQILQSLGQNIPYVNSLKRGVNDQTAMLELAGSLFGLNAEIDLVAVNATDEFLGGEWGLAHGVMATDLPPYQHTYGPINYYESRVSREFRLRKIPRHDLIGSKMPGCAKLRPQFRNVLRLKDLPWLGDHRLLPDVVFPAAGYVAMATTAASQVYAESQDARPITGYLLRNVDIKKALRIPENQHGIEVVLSLELVDAQDPKWISFSISSVSHDSDQFTEHCTGTVKIDLSNPIKGNKLIAGGSDTRPVSARDWYRTFAAVGLGYGPAFQGLSEIYACPRENSASARLDLQTTAGIIRGGESKFAVHPASLDALIQLGLLACHGGQIDRVTTAFVPIHLSYMHLRTGINQDWETAVAQGNFKGQRSAYIQLQLQSQTTGEVLLDIKDLRCISYNLEDQGSASRHTNKAFDSPFARLVYEPDFRALSNRQAQVLFGSPVENICKVPILRALEEIASLTALDVYESLLSGGNSNQMSESEATNNYLSWIRRLVEKRSNGVVKALQLSPLERRQMLSNLYQEVGPLVETKALERLHERMADVVSNRLTGEEVLAEGGLLADFYTESLFVAGIQPQLARAFHSLGHVNPSLRIIELKGGRGLTARLVLEALSVAGNAIKRYHDYTVTDVSEEALEQARGLLATHRDIEFSILDIEQDTLQQGYQPIYDVVLASQAVHTASSVTKALANARKLLRRGGKLVLVEVTSNSACVGFIGGAQKGYWHGIPDGRIDSPFLNVTEWNAALQSAGFSGADLTLDDYPSPVTQSTIIVSSIAEESSLTSIQKTVWLLHGAKGAPGLVSQLAHELERRHLLVKIISIDDSPEKVPTNAHVIAFLDDENLLLNADQRRLHIFQYLAHHAASMVWLTSTGMAQGYSPDGAVVGGLLRILSTESPTGGRYVSIDTDADAFKLISQEDLYELLRVISDQALALQQTSDEVSDTNHDREFAWRNGCLWVSRLVPEVALQGYTERLATPAAHNTELLPLDAHGPVRAAFETPGILSSLYFRPYTELLQQPLPPDWMDIKVVAAGLNWKDVALSTGRFDANSLSSEYAGVVTRVGVDAASRFAVGDLVYGLGQGNFGNYERVPAAFADKADPKSNLADLADLAALPIVSMTAVYAFEHLAHLRSGQKILIQSASGGLGQVAIRLARAKGAEVFAMVGSQEKASFLVEQVHLPPSHVFMAGGTAALSHAMAAIGSNKDHRDIDGLFDVILSTAHGDMLYETAKALAPLGHFIDVGRLDVMDARSIGLELFQKGATFSSFDLYHVVDHDPELGTQLIQAVGEHFRNGRITPIRPLSISDISQLDQTLMSFSRGTHVGKFVVKFDPASRVRMVTPPPAVSFDPKACYVITGGLSGLGRSIIQWMSDRGARELVVLSRRGSSAPEAQMLVNVMAERGVRLQPVACDLSNRAQVVQAIKQASSRGPVKGIVHCAVVYQDISFNKLSLDGWRNGLAAKVQGTQNLHDATLNLPLDFFVMTTSVLSVFGFATQGAYTAANNFQDQFARYRRRLGLPATAAQFGLVNDIGHLSTDSTTLDMVVRNKVLSVPECYFLRLLEPAFVSHHDSQAVALDPLAMSTYVTCMDPAQMVAKERENTETGGLMGGPPPRWHSDARVSHVLQALEDARRHTNTDEDASRASGQGRGDRSAVVQLRRHFDDAVRQTRAAPTGPEKTQQRTEVVELVTGSLRTTIAAMLLMDESAINASRSVSDHGVDSLIATEFRNWLQLALGSKISMVDLLDSRTSIDALAAKVVDIAIQSEKGM